MYRMDSEALKHSPFVTILDLAIYTIRHAISCRAPFRKSRPGFRHLPIGNGAINCFRGKDASRDMLIAPSDAQASVLISEYLRKINPIGSRLATGLPPLQSRNESGRPANINQHSHAERTP
jgi:hypothetical protein